MPLRSPRPRPPPEIPDIDAQFVGGKDDALEKVSRWLEKVSNSPEVEGDVTLTLSQSGIGTPRPLATFPFSPGDAEQVVSVADDIVEHAVEAGESIASDNGGKIRFVVSGDTFRGQQGFTLDFPESDDDDHDYVPDESGVLSMALKHAQFMANFAKDVFKTNTLDNRQAMSEMRSQMRENDKNRLDSIKVFAELYDSKFERDITLKRLAVEEERKEKIVGTLVAGVPAVMNKFLGQGTVPVETTPFEQQMMGFLSTVNGEQWTKLAQTGKMEFTQTQLHAFAEIFKTALEKDETAKAAVEAMRQKLSTEKAEEKPPPETPPTPTAA